MKEFQIFQKKYERKAPNVNYRDDKRAKVISYSQLSKYNTCQKSWELRHVRHHYVDDPSIYLVFGNAMHEVLQKITQLLYTKTVKAATKEYDYAHELKMHMVREYQQDVKKYGYHFSSKEELQEFYQDGVEIIKYLLKKRKVFYDLKHEKLIGIEMPVYMPVRECTDKTIYLLCYLDLVFYDTFNKRIKIQDIKTSTKGWSKWDKEDFFKKSQLTLYKKYFAEQYGIEVDDIEVEFFILKRKVNEDAPYPVPRIQRFKPASGKVSFNKIDTVFKEFVNTVFNEDGSYNTEREYIANEGHRPGWNCKFCPYNEREDLCPKDKRIQTSKT